MTSAQPPVAGAQPGTGAPQVPESETGGTSRPGGCGSCSCGQDGSGGCGGGRVPELDARTIDPALRNAAVFGVLVALVPGSSAVIIDEAEPEVVLMLIAERFPGQYEITGAQAAPGEWRAKFARVA